MNEQLLLEIKEKVEKIDDRMHSIDITLVKQNVALDEHMRRTAANEEKLEIYEKRVEPALDAYKFMAAMLKGIIAVLIPVIGLIIGYFQIKS